MKKTSVYILLVLYMAVQLKPLTAIVQDVLAHTFFRVQHMATIHFENGKYHLHTELENIAKEDGGISKEKTPSPEKITESQQIIHKLHFDMTLTSILIPAPTHPDRELAAGHSRISSPPPKQV